MLDRSLSLTFRDFSTYFLIVAAIVLPLELVYGAVFSDVISVRELHAEVERLPEGASMLGVTADRLVVARWSRWGLNLLQLGLLPWMAGATRRALDISDRGEVPALARALAPRRREGRRPPRRGGAIRGHSGLLLTTATISLAIGLLGRYLGELAIQPLQGSGWWALVGVVETVARAAGAPFFLVAWAETIRSGEGEGKRATNLY